MLSINLRHLFFLILGLNILVTFFFWNTSKAPIQQAPGLLNPIELATQSLIETSEHHKNTPLKRSITSAGVYLKAQGKATYIDDLQDKTKNHGDIRKAMTKIADYKKLRDFDFPVKDKYTLKDIEENINGTLQKYTKQLQELKLKYKEDLKKLELMDHDIVNDMKRTRDGFSVANPFRYFGLYTYMRDELFNASPISKAKYDKTIYGIKKDASYCDIVDVYNLYHPENIFGNMNFLMDYTHGSLVRDLVGKKIGRDAMHPVSMAVSRKKGPTYPLNPNITMFFTKRIDFHHFNEISVNFLCITQSYGHLPGNGVLTRKDLNIEKINQYTKRYEKNQRCFNKNMFFPPAYRLNIIEECKEFFNIINSPQFIEKKKTEPIQFIIKQGHSAHRASGLYLFDEDEEKHAREVYGNGAKCGENLHSILAQTYITNPLLLDKQNKFDFRIYMLIASVNPLIVYYHDGFLRLSLTKYDKYSKEKNVHFTNTHLSKEIFAIAQKEKEYQGMSEEQLREYQMWTMEELAEYLFEIGKISDKNWLNGYLKPKFQEAFTHIARMTENDVLKHSGAFELFGLDFMLDNNLDLWFIECNSSPQLIGTSDEKTKFLVQLLTDMFEIQNNLLRSRFKRIQQFMAKLQTESLNNKAINIRKVRQNFAIINRNKFEPEYAISPNNSFTLILDKSYKGAAAYFGHLREECIDD